MRRHSKKLVLKVAIIVSLAVVLASACGKETGELQSATLVATKPKESPQAKELAVKPVEPQAATTLAAIASNAEKQATSGEVAKEVVYLTFDGGPGPRTPEFLEALESWDAKATFFVTGSYTEKDPAMLKRIVASGHAIANHSWDHPDMTTIGDVGVRYQLQRTQFIVKEVTSIDMTCWRPPFGATNKDVQDIADANGLTNEKWIKDGRWDVDTIDWREGYDFVLKRLQTIEGGDVVLMHSGNNPDEEDLAALTTWMETNQDAYRFEALPGC